MKNNLALIGFLQALGVVVYAGLVSGLFLVLEKVFVNEPGLIGFALMLVIFVFSAAVTGSLVFGYPAYLAFNKKTKEAIQLLGYNLLYIVGFIAVIFIFLTFR